MASHCATQVWCSQSLCPRGRSLLTHASAGDTQTPKGKSGSVPCWAHCSFPWVLVCTIFFFFLHPLSIWRVWNLILNMIAPLLLSSWSFSFALGCGLSFSARIQHSPVDGCLATSCDFGWRRKWQPTPVLLPRKFHGWRSLVGYSPWSRKESDMTEWLSSACIYGITFFTYYLYSIIFIFLHIALSH